MTITIEDIETGRVTLGRLGETPAPPLTPGEVLQLEFLEPLGLTAYAVAKAINVPINRITGILGGKRAISAETALRLGRYFGMSAQFFLNLQGNYDLRIAAAQGRDALERIVPRRAAE